MFKKITKASVNVIERYLPDAYLFAAILTIATFVFAIIGTGQTPMQMIQHWGNGFWSLLGFSMQMAMVVVTGYVLADTEPVSKALDKIAAIPKSPKSAIALVSVVSSLAFFLNWGFALVVGAILAKRIAQKVDGVDYRLLIATSYASIALWHGGISGSIPLNLASQANLETITKQTQGVITEIIPTSRTIFAGWNLIIQVALLLVLAVTFVFMTPDKKDAVVIDKKLLEEEKKKEVLDKSKMTPAEKVENSLVFTILIGAMGVAYAVWYFATKGFNLSLDLVNFVFLFLGLILHKTPRKFLDSVSKAASSTAGVMLQFPFYAGIMGMMIGKGDNGLSLAGIISNGFVSIATPKTFPLFTYLSAGIVNFFVPSGGGQWAVQAPIMMPAGAKLGVDPAVTGMAIAYGDAWTNLIQPFWALPALGIAGLGARDIMGFCLLALIGSGIVTSLGFLLLV